MRHVIFSFKNKRYALLFNCLAMLELQDKYGNIGDIVNMIYGKSENENDVESFENLCDIIEILSEQSSNVKYELGYDRPEIIRARQLICLSAPKDLAILRHAAITAINKGLEQEVDNDNSDIDIGLLELQKKTEPTD